ncbi:MAG: prephenate dehydrogenase/arogenate dehydrogenase family protein [Chloroflexi bacterium]|nr:prephenate dehydrogenase/arogenate dehydrogenase family protein [Chloroflexota bacterium]
MRVALLGLGLIGGSIARALRRPDDDPARRPWISAWTPDGRGPRAALAAGAVDVAAGSIGEAVDGASLVILAAPPLACLDLIDRSGEQDVRDRFATDVLLTDVASTKAAIVARAVRLDLPFVGGHPMAGRETSGFGSADDLLFRGRPWVVVPTATSPAGGVDRIAALARACGAAPVVMDAADHDAAVAGISHLPLIVAAALAGAVFGPAGDTERPDAAAARALAASGWASATRLARGDPTMAAGIAATNAASIVARIRDLEAVLVDWRVQIERGDPAELTAAFAEARARLEAPDGGDADEAG